MKKGRHVVDRQTSSRHSHVVDRQTCSRQTVHVEDRNEERQTCSRQTDGHVVVDRQFFLCARKAHPAGRCLLATYIQYICAH